jgi:multidrug efflux pump subunit AcrA (membrane-fusion protein)
VSLGDDPRGATDPKYKDKKIDSNTPVDEGTVLARIDDAVYKALVQRAQAETNRAQAELKLAVAKYKSAQEQAKAGLAKIDPGTEAAVAVAEADLAEAKVALEQAKIGLDNTVIRSPVKGVVLSRRVNVGQNVAPGDFHAHSLFLIAKDLRKMQVWASVNEADISRIHEGMTARFTVDAFPKDVFEGKVVQIRQNAQKIQDVVCYTVIVSFDNPDEKLLPYMTANARFEVAKASGPLGATGSASARSGETGVAPVLTVPPRGRTAESESHTIDLSSPEGKAALPPEPYTIEPGDSLYIRAVGTLIEQPIDGIYVVEPTGTVALPPAYGRVNLKGLSLVEAEKAIAQQLSQILRQPEVSVTLAGWIDRSKLEQKPQPHRIAPGDILDIWANSTLVDQPIHGPYLVEPDGQVSLGPAYGRVNLKGLTFQEAEAVVTKKLSEILRSPEVSITLGGWRKERRADGKTEENPPRRPSSTSRSTRTQTRARVENALPGLPTEPGTSVQSAKESTPANATPYDILAPWPWSKWERESPTPQDEQEARNPPTSSEPQKHKE